MADGDSSELLDARLVMEGEGIAILQPAGEIDISSVDTLTDQFIAISARRPENVILDATRVSFMDSAGLHALTDGKRMLQEQGTQVFLVPSPQVKRVLELVFPDPLFAASVDSVEEALSRIQLHQPRIASEVS